MKIAAVEPIHLKVPYDYGGPLQKADGIPWHSMEILLVKVTTDAGIVGWGEAFGFSACAVTKTAIEKGIAPLAVGQDPKNIPALTADIASKLHNWGRNGPASFGLSGLDIALWDIAGKIANKPLYKLLGASTTVERLPAYASLLRYGSSQLVERNCEKALAEGYTRIKLHEIDVASVASARRCIGRTVPLMIDTNCPWPADKAISMARAFAEHDIFWIEEPVWPPDDHDALRRVRSEGGIPTAAGENAGTYTDLKQLITAANVDYLQPSVAKIGGISEMLRAAELANSHGCQLAPHSPFFGPALAATIHFSASRSSPPHIERFYCDLKANPLGEAINPVDGHIAVPQKPGLGIDIDEQLLNDYEVN